MLSVGKLFCQPGSHGWSTNLVFAFPALEARTVARRATGIFVLVVVGPNTLSFSLLSYNGGGSL